jgi:uncharacterized protein
MLTSDLVEVRRRGDELTLPAIAGKIRAELVELAEEVLSGARLLIGHPRSEWDAFVATLGETTHQKKLARGLARLVEQACSFEIPTDGDAELLRTAAFDAAARAWRALPPGAGFDRTAIVEEAARAVGILPDTVDRALYADLPFAQILLGVPELGADDLVRQYDESRVQAVLLRAVQVRVLLPWGSGDRLRYLFGCLKFRRLMFETERVGTGQLRLIISGPFSLFESVAKYGLELALLWPAVRAMGSFELEADVKWGKSREARLFKLDTRGEAGPEAKGAAAGELRTEVAELLEGLGRVEMELGVQLATTLLEIPGVGVCVPDLTFQSPDGRRAHLEVLGYWSRESVWKRVELARAGLAEPVLFVCGSRLRVSEEVLDEDASGALLVYRGKLNPRAVVRAIEALLQRPRKSRGG